MLSPVALTGIIAVGNLPGASASALLHDISITFSFPDFSHPPMLEVFAWVIVMAIALRRLSTLTSFRETAFIVAMGHLCCLALALGTLLWLSDTSALWPFRHQFPRCPAEPPAAIGFVSVWIGFRLLCLSWLLATSGLSGVASTFSFRTAGRTPIQAKLWTEPIPSGAADFSALRNLRRAARELGGRWPRLTAIGLEIDELRTDSSESEDTSEWTQWVAVVVLAPCYLPEQLTVALTPARHTGLYCRVCQCGT